MLNFWWITRRRRAYVGPASVSLAVKRSMAMALACVLAHTGAMMLAEGLGAMDSLWLTLTTIMTVGYGDLSAKTAMGRLATIVILYGVGIYAVATLASSLLTRRAENLEAKRTGNWSWNMKNHIIIVASVKEGAERFFERLARQLDLDPRYAECDVLLAGESFPQGLPESLSRRGWAPLRLCSHDVAFCEKTHASKALAAIVCSTDEKSEASDPATFELCARLRACMPEGAHIVAECVSDAWRPRVMSAATAVARPARSYPEMLGRALCAPGSEQVVENLLDAGGETLLRVELSFKGKWSAVGVACFQTEAGLPLAYQAQDGSVVSNPKPSEMVRAAALYLVAPEGSNPVQIGKALAQALSASSASTQASPALG